MSVDWAARPPRIDPGVFVADWDMFLRFMGDRWEPGQHIASIGPTGEGKTTFNARLLGVRKYVCALDPKGEDETLTASGFVRVTKLPPPHPWSPGFRFSGQGRLWHGIEQDIAEGRDARIIVGGPADTAEQDARLIKLLADAVAYVRQVRGWTLYVDEFELMSSQRMYALGRPIEQMLITARRAKTSVLTSFQAAAWVSKHATRQARYAVMYSTGDRAMIKAVAESMGRDWHALAEAVDELEKFYVLVIPRGRNGGPMILTTAPPLPGV